MAPPAFSETKESSRIRCTDWHELRGQFRATYACAGPAGQTLPGKDIALREHRTFRPKGHHPKNGEPHAEIGCLLANPTSPICKQQAVLSILDIVLEDVSMKTVREHCGKPRPKAKDVGSPDLQSEDFCQFCKRIETEEVSRLELDLHAASLASWHEAMRYPRLLFHFMMGSQLSKDGLQGQVCTCQDIHICSCTVCLDDALGDHYNYTGRHFESH